MACNECNHTMQNLGIENQRVFWCPRCGTVKSVDGQHENVTRPFRCDRYHLLREALLASQSAAPDFVRLTREALRESRE